MQAALAATLAFVAGVLWQELRVDAAVARPISSASVARSRVVIERLPPRSGPGSPQSGSTSSRSKAPAPSAAASSAKPSLALAGPTSSTTGVKRGSPAAGARKKALKSKRARQVARRRHHGR
jgi:hypothetical protein